jgi:hypothetical protein
MRRYCPSLRMLDPLTRSPRPFSAISAILALPSYIPGPFFEGQI